MNEPFQPVICRAVITLGKMASRSFKHFLGTAKDGEYYVTIRQEKPKRTEAQNRYYWGAYLPIVAAETGYTKDELHAIAKEALLRSGMTTAEFGGKVYQIPVYKFGGSTTNMSTTEFSDFIERCETLWGIAAPPPTEFAL